MKLVDLHPRFIAEGGDGITIAGQPVPRREGVGIVFDCPCGCDSPVYVPFANPLDGGPQLEGGRGWQRTGDTFETLTLSPSVLRIGGCGWHGFVTAGEVRTT